MRSAAGILAAVLCAALLCGSARADDDPYAGLLAPADTCGPSADQLNLDHRTAELAMLCLTNYARTQAGLAPLTMNATLTAAGDAKLAADVACGVFSHEPCGQPFATVFAAYTKGATSYQIGENIAWGTDLFETPRAIMDAWLHSDGHRENILTPEFTELGIGYLPDQTFQGYAGAALWSQQFGVRTPILAAKPVVQKPAAKKKPHKKRVRQAHSP